MHSTSRFTDDSESGLISVSAVVGIAFAALVVYLLLAALDGDSTHYGKVPIPSENVPIELPSGETDIYLAETGTQQELGNVEVPDDLQYTFTGENGDVVRSMTARGTRRRPMTGSPGSSPQSTLLRPGPTSSPSRPAAPLSSVHPSSPLASVRSERSRIDSRTSSTSSMDRRGSSSSSRSSFSSSLRA